MQKKEAFAVFKKAGSDCLDDDQIILLTANKPLPVMLPIGSYAVMKMCTSSKESAICPDLQET